MCSLHHLPQAVPNAEQKTLDTEKTHTCKDIKATEHFGISCHNCAMTSTRQDIKATEHFGISCHNCAMTSTRQDIKATEHFGISCHNNHSSCLSCCVLFLTEFVLFRPLLSFVVSVFKNSTRRI